MHLPKLANHLTLQRDTYAYHKHVDALIERFRPQPRETWDPYFGPSPQEFLVLKGIMLGKANKEIADDLKILENSVKVHVTSLLKKFGYRTRHQLIVAVLSGRAQIIR
jgi:DNA-binding NarL/FixJ family response regulator